MTITEDLRKTLSNASPLYFAAGTADLAAEKLRELPAHLDRLRAEAPQRIQTVREQELPKLREQAQTLATQGREAAREYATKARETYEGLAERGRGAVDTWRAGADAERSGSEDDAGPEVTLERAEPLSEPELGEGAAAKPAGDGPRP